MAVTIVSLFNREDARAGGVSSRNGHKVKSPDVVVMSVRLIFHPLQHVTRSRGTAGL